MFLADLSRALPIVHRMDFVELAGYGGRSTGGASAVRLLKDLDADILDRDVLLVEDVVDTGLTLNYLTKSFRLRSPRSLAVVTLLDRPYRRVVDDLPVRYVGFTAPDEFFVGYGFDLDERYRSLPDLPRGSESLSDATEASPYRYPSGSSDAVDAHLEMQMRAGRVAGRADIADHLSLRDGAPVPTARLDWWPYAVATPPPWSMTTRLP